MNNRAVVFRADASLEMGTGHLMRCLTLANALQAQGRDCHFICREHTGNLIEYVRQQGHEVHPLACISDAEMDGTPIHARWLGATQAQDAVLCAAILSNLQPQWLVVDHYALDARWEQQLKPHYHKLLVIDDLADRPHQCDVLLDQTLGRDPLDYQPWVPAGCRVLCGAQYALLRPEFAALRSYSLQRRQSAPLHHILVSMGGVDKDNATGQILTALATAELPAEGAITVVMGSTAPWLETIRRQAARMPVTTLVRSGVSDMAQLMADSDLAIGAAGATSWERCCLGLPTIMVVLADNQQQVAAGLQNAQAVRVLAASQDIPLALPILMRELLQSTGQLHLMSEAAAAVTDGTGTTRVIGHLE
ncbi:UDP-2,4-diacetamido-2,4,6-trideoxy-beta-L-altropyranose hydrolase [Pseudomonas sp. MYb185]|uniref:UDP-2,4-diacetamido-2,4, 6-trideoxy-beta-L-altropyranose hydrolase n=1 Tax=Pseudomonas sp. MYb185 TaxID=1848729 RepID=UPI000CFB99A8|nr:UDP-2,4-diacetamido-2,4,6-trideoxy-beta-L-altropyranose hydrolase [Pseudomonas sp. MYb185]PRB84048.1 UDP-2,4-diacetamido-2,4,6-trideoxy-beta-L-altropyranose hydrolase [Pseudomonas sp. MYb185]